MLGIGAASKLQGTKGEGMLLAIESWLWVGFGILYIILLVTLGVMTLRNGHWVMFIIGIVFPLFWVIGALMGPKEPRAATPPPPSAPPPPR
jgi:hypothetical protein